MPSLIDVGVRPVIGTSGLDETQVADLEQRCRARGIGGVVVLLAVWEIFARSGMYSTAMTPPVESIAAVIWQMLLDGSLIENALATLVRVFIDSPSVAPQAPAAGPFYVGTFSFFGSLLTSVATWCPPVVRNGTSSAPTSPEAPEMSTRMTPTLSARQ